MKFLGYCKDKWISFFIFAVVFANNPASINMLKKCGFREIGYREKIAKDKFGVWQDTVLLERRNSIM